MLTLVEQLQHNEEAKTTKKQRTIQTTNKTDKNCLLATFS